MSMTATELATHVSERLPKGCGIFIAMTADKPTQVSIMDGRNNKNVTETTFHVEQHRDLEATVLDALSHADAGVQ